MLTLKEFLILRLCIKQKFLSENNYIHMQTHIRIQIPAKVTMTTIKSEIQFCSVSMQ